MTAIPRDAFIPAGVLLIFAVIGSALLSGTFQLTRERIEETERAARMALIAQALLPPLLQYLKRGCNYV